MPKSELSGTVLSFRRSKHRQYSDQTIVRIDGGAEVGNLVGARVAWVRADGFQISGRVAARHGSGGAFRVTWNRGFPPQALGSQVQIRLGSSRRPPEAKPTSDGDREPAAERRTRKKSL